MAHQPATGFTRSIRQMSIACMVILAIVGCTDSKVSHPHTEIPAEVSPESAIAPLLNDPAVSEFAKAILEDFKVTKQEMRDAELAFGECLAAHDLEANIANQAYGVTEPSQDAWAARHPTLSRGEALDALEDIMGNCADSTVGIIDSVYYSFQ